jgi:hypothetical protein
MPYKIVGNKVMHQKDGKWSTKQTCQSHANAVKAVRLLRGVEHGMIPRRKK